MSLLGGDPREDWAQKQWDRYDHPILSAIKEGFERLREKYFIKSAISTC